MAYFNHAFNKVFVGTGGLAATAGTATTALTAGQFTFVDPTTWTVPAGGIIDNTTLACPLVLVSKSIYANDKIGPFHGGYQESVKSKIINPKYITDFYKVDNCPLRADSVSVGQTIDSTSTGYITPCEKDFNFVCGETYYLRVDLKGSPALRYLSRNSYLTASAYTGCCADPNAAPESVNPLVVYINWAYQLLNSPLTGPFLRISVQYGVNGASKLNSQNWFTNSTADLKTLNDYIMGVTSIPAATLSGIIIQGAYIDTQFGDCTFYPTDALQAYLEPVKIYASMVDYNGDPCAFTGVCTYNTCLGRQGQGFGENIIRELILSEAYNQSPFYTGMDLRIREITQGYNVTTAISRTTQYDRYFIKHSVPRFNNPTGTFDNDQYLLEVIVPSGFVGTAFEGFVNDWIANAQGATCVQMTTYSCAANTANCTAVAALTPALTGPYA